MTLLNIQTELSWLRPLFERLVIAAERIAGPLPEVSPVAPRQSDLSDYAYVGEDELARIQVEQDIFARKNLVVPGSEAHILGVALYEQQILDSYGEDGPAIVAKLPWKVQAKDPSGIS